MGEQSEGEGGAGASRLDGLLGLLGTGTSPSVRRMAASQIGDLVAAHPTKAKGVLQRVRKFLRSTDWDTRVAAGYAIKAISDQTPPHVVRDAPDRKAVAELEDEESSFLTFQTLDLERLLEHGVVLLGSSGEEYIASGVDVTVQRQQLRRDLGLDDRFGGGEDVLGLKDEDLVMDTTHTVGNSETNAQTKKQRADDYVAELEKGQMSKREANRLKREARKRERTNPSNCQIHEMDTAKRKREDETVKVEDVIESASDGDDNASWLFASTCRELKEGLLKERWEYRHGAAVGLREILKKHAGSAGRVSMGEEGDQENFRWLEDVACRLLCVLALDRFGDFVGDGVVAPVRETASMAIAAAAKAMDQSRVERLLELLQTLLHTEKRKHWDVRHAALLGIKYLLSVSLDRESSLLPAAFGSILEGLVDEDDDVRAVAADALDPAVEATMSLIPARISELLTILWSSLLDLDDLSASTASLLRLLTRVYEVADKDDAGVPPRWTLLVVQEEVEMDMEEEGPQESKTVELDELVPRLWPFMRHKSVAVRRASISALRSLLLEKRKNDSLRWIRKLCGSVLDRVFRNVLLESDKEVLQISQEVWNTINPMLTGTPEDILLVVSSTQPFLKHWFILASHESRTAALAYDNSVQGGTEKRDKISAKRAAYLKRRAMGKNGGTRQYLGSEGDELTTKTSQSNDNANGAAQEDPEEAILMQVSASSVLGSLGCIWPQDDSKLQDVLLEALQSPYVLSRRVACNVVEAWGRNITASNSFSDDLYRHLDAELNRNGGCEFAELSSSISSLFTDVRAIVQALEEDLSAEQRAELTDVNLAVTTELVNAGIEAAKKNDASKVVSLSGQLQETATYLATAGFERWEVVTASQKGKKRKREVLSAVRMHVLASIGYLAVKRDMLQTSLAAAASAAAVAVRSKQLPKLVTPHIKALMAAVRTLQSLRLQQNAGRALALLLRRLHERGTVKPISLVVKNLSKHLSAVRLAASSQSADDQKAKNDEHRGAGIAFKACATEFGSELFKTLPMLWDTMSNPLLAELPDDDAVIVAMMVCRATAPALEESQLSQLAQLLPAIISLCASKSTSTSSEAGLCLADLVLEMPSIGMDAVVRRLVPLLQQGEETEARRGAASALGKVVDSLDDKIIPYAAFLIVPMMVRMVDQDELVRDAAAGVFGKMVRLIPLEEGAPDDAQMSASMQAEREEAREFLGQLLGSRTRKHYKMPIPIGDDVTLRKYQQECLDWLSFMGRYGLHGALCDDMGLGKTLMTLCIIAAETHKLHESGNRTTPSLVICPATIAAHWQAEALRFFGKTSLQRVVMYIGPPKRRAEIRSGLRFQDADLIVTSYEVLSSDLDHFQNVQWNYQVLDEGHVIKNPKTKVAKAVRCISAQHRLFLSGTPIQNSVLELWSIFDFLMPGFLGSEKSFKEMFSKPIIAQRDPKCTEKDRERGMAAMESLHRQVLPFVLRRLKDDVLSELPPKVMQDYYCTMTPLQVRLYEDFSRAALKKSTGEGDIDEKEQSVQDMQEGSGEGGKKAGGKSGAGHIFQALQYLRRLCSHPALVLNEKHPEYAAITKEMKAKGTSIHDVVESPKLVALEDLLYELGIGSAEVLTNKESGGHRVLIFAQMKSMLDLVENDLFRARMPRVTFLRMDGSVEATKRHSIVTRFNADPTIDCLLLTTHVGGLGLNLTGADTVIFLEHDWNPTKDLQAMDRAHRIGQKRTVNVYRFIMRGTLEEKIMSIQKFKTHIANTVINRENSSLASMNTSDLLNLFHVDDSSSATTSSDSTAVTAAAASGLRGKSARGLKAAVEQLNDLWDEQQYKDEYNLDEFVQSVAKN